MRMARKTTPDDFSTLVRSARATIPDVAITTDIIVGFPGETQQEFSETLEFVKSMDFAGGHVFSYSPRPGTPASRMKGQVSGEIARSRSKIIRKVLADSAQMFYRKFIGKTLPVLWEANATQNEAGWQIEGLTDNYLRVTAIAPEPRWNLLDAVQILDVHENCLVGKLINNV